MLKITKPDRVVDLKKIAKVRKIVSLTTLRKIAFDDFSRYLRFPAVLCHVNVNFSPVYDHLSLPNLL